MFVVKAGKNKKRSTSKDRYLTIDNIKGLCLLTNVKNINDVDLVLIDKYISYYKKKYNSVKKEQEYLRKKGEKVSQKSIAISKKCKNILTFLQTIKNIPQEEWINKDYVNDQLLLDYKTIISNHSITNEKNKRLKINISFSESIMMLNEKYKYIYSLLEIENVINHAKRMKTNANNALLCAAGLSVILCGAFWLNNTNPDYTKLGKYVEITRNIDSPVDELDEAVVVIKKDDLTISDINDNENILINTDNSEKNTTNEQAPKYNLDVNFDELQKINGDIRAYILFENQGISHPVLGCSDNEKYLRTSYTGKYSYAGSLFIDYRNSFEIEDVLTIIYGHNMKNGSMFGFLKNYKNNTYAEENKNVQIATPEGIKKYEVVAAGNILSGSDFFEVGKMGTPDIIHNSIEKSNILNTGYEFKLGDKLVALSTCTGLTHQNRFVVLLKEI